MDDIYKRWPNEKLLPLFKDYEDEMNLLQLHWQTWTNHCMANNDPDSAIIVLMLTSQACFIRGYEEGRKSMERDTIIPDSIKNLDVSGILE